jgi:hypothetical protein
MWQYFILLTSAYCVSVGSDYAVWDTNAMIKKTDAQSAWETGTLELWEPFKVNQLSFDHINWGNEDFNAHVRGINNYVKVIVTGVYYANMTNISETGYYSGCVMSVKGNAIANGDIGFCFIGRAAGQVNYVDVARVEIVSDNKWAAISGDQGWKPGICTFALDTATQTATWTLKSERGE